MEYVNVFSSLEYALGPACDAFNFMSGFMFFDVDLSLTDALILWIDLSIKNGNMRKLNFNAYNASWAAVASTYESSQYVDPIINNTAWRESSYKFCEHELYGTCSLYIVNSYGDQVFDKTLTEYMFLVNDGACSPQFLVSDAAFESIIHNPPTPIVEDYYACTLTPLNAVINAAGIASGNASLILPLVMAGLLPLMYVWLTATGNVKPKPEYSEEDKQTALDYMALQVLRVRDKRVRGMKKNGILVQFGNELVKAVEEADGQPVDSDDSDDDSEGSVNPMSKPVTTNRRASKISQGSDISKQSRRVSKRLSATDMQFISSNNTLPTQANSSINRVSARMNTNARNQGVDSDDENDLPDRGVRASARVGTAGSNPRIAKATGDVELASISTTI